MPLGCLASLFGIREKAAASRGGGVPGRPGARPAPPESLPLKVRRYFFTRDEAAFFEALEAATADLPYRVLTKVRLGDLFDITDKVNSGATRGRLKDKHVDFLLVHTRDHYRPVLAIELDGVSHTAEQQQYRDAVKDTAFRCGGLRLLRVPSRTYTVAQVRDMLHREGLDGG
ncbi:DUF2726 domain-containing protein [uncultured Deinococcus sp.]|uniref:DUF2726 domain-containing protein n=1 Tax=uncultured Deinococcus sp. TaxID=158789 RepID=UPI00258D2714|nr:DUF2726 domain-containing protein [uncultured Deinococcus sp.]